MTEEELGDLFAQRSTVIAARIITDRFMGWFLGFGFVEMGSDPEARITMEALDGTDVRVLKVKEAHERRRRDERREGAIKNQITRGVADTSPL